MATKRKRKKVNVRINKLRKSSGDDLSVDLKSAAEDEIYSAPVKKAIIREKAATERKKETAVSTAPLKPQVKKQTGLQLNLYRKIAVSFVVLTLGLLAIIFYFSFIGVTITVVPKEERISNNLIIDINDPNKVAVISQGAVVGAVDKIEVKEIKIYSASGKEIIGEETTGTVTIINNYNKSQPLVATTRLLSSDNKLFRLKNTVNVPAGGSVEAEVYADKPGADMAMGPTKFTIPGLWAGLQEKIYAESKKAFTHSQKAKKHITQSDIDFGIKDLRKRLLEKAEKDVGESYKSYSQTLFNIDENSISIDIDGKVGEEKNDFSVTMTTEVAVVAFNEELIKNMAREKLMSVIASDKELIGFDENNLTYNLDSHNLNQGIATINVSFEGKSSFKSGVSIIDRKKIVGLTREQLDDFLANEQAIENYEVSFQPKFIDKVPNLIDRIKIKIK